MKIILPTILASILVIAGVFAFMPLEEAATVHTTIQNNAMTVDQGEDLTNRVAAGDTDTGTITISSADNTPFVLYSVIACVDTGLDASGDVVVTTLTVDGDTIQDEDGSVITGISIADGSNVVACQDILSVFADATDNNGLNLSGGLASDGGDIVFGITLAEGTEADKDTLTSVKAVGIVRGDTTLTVVTAIT